jgi:predicted DsbA family dithiol-disulfide isomerase
MKPMRVEIWSDVVCPWCYIGKRRFESALASFKYRDQVEIVWKSFQLDPGAPRTSDLSLDEMLSKKYGMSREKAAAANARVTSLAAQEGLDYHLDQARPGNTFDAHRLIHLAAAHGKQGEMKERLMRAYFTEGQPIGEVETLVKLAAEVGLDAEEARAVLASDTYADEVTADEREARQLGITGVPFFVIGEKYGISGAQPGELFQQALEQAWAESRPLIQVSSASAEDVGGCDGDSCAI